MAKLTFRQELMFAMRRAQGVPLCLRCASC